MDREGPLIKVHDLSTFWGVATFNNVKEDMAKVDWVYLLATMSTSAQSEIFNEEIARIQGFNSIIQSVSIRAGQEI